MQGFLLVARCALSAVFAVAGVAKLVDRAGSRQSMREFGIPVPLAAPLAVALPVTELACAVALPTGAFAWWGALGSAALLALFIVGIVVNLARGRTPDCHCFGKLHSEPVGWSTVARNAVLAAIAAFVVAQGQGQTGPGLLAWLASLTGVQSTFLGLVVWITGLTALVATVLIQLLAQNGRLMLRIEALEAKTGGRTDPAVPEPGLPVNSPAPAFSLTGLDGIPVSLEALSAVGGKPVLLVFSEAGCSACDALLPDVGRWQREHSDGVMIVPITSGDLHANKAKALRHELQNVLLQATREVADAYQVQRTPGAVLVKDGLIASSLTVGPDAIRDLVFRHTLPPAVTQGAVAPSLSLRDIDGKPTDVAAMNGRRRVLLFWNPTCGFCKAMLKDVKSWERTRSRSAPELLIISAGSPESNREQRFKSHLVIDPVFGAGQVFGATGTPSAVTLDELGRVVSPIVVGASAVLEMLGAPIDSGVTV